MTGAAGFIGFHVSQALLKQGKLVVGLDNLNDYYSVQLKQDRLAQLQTFPNFEFLQLDLVERRKLFDIFADQQLTHVIHLAAQAGVRYSIDNPQAYIDSNLLGFSNILECCRHFPVEHFLYASSSSVYGLNSKMPFSVSDNVDHPVSLYAATKKSNELLAHSYAYLYQIPTTGLRFFTVYGPWGRPDMAYFKFTQRIFAGQPIEVYNQGNMQRDFTYIDDIVAAIIKLVIKPAQSDKDWNSGNPNPGSSIAPYRLYNIGNNKPVSLETFIATLEQVIGKKAQQIFLPMQAGDVPATYANVDALVEAVDFKPKTSIEVGLKFFVDWFREYHGARSGGRQTSSSALSKNLK